MDAPINTPITLVICARSSLAQTGLAALASSPENALGSITQIVGKTNSLRSLNHWLQTQTADLALIDLSLAESEDIDDLAQTIEALPPEENLPFLVLVESDSENEFFAQLLQTRMLGTGLVSLLPTTVSTNQIMSAIATITQGLTVIHPDITKALLDPAIYRLAAIEFNLENLSSDNISEPLTPRESQVLNQLANGSTNKAIASTLGISEHTAKFHISTILSKLHVSSRTEAVAVGIRTGLVKL